VPESLLVKYTCLPLLDSIGPTPPRRVTRRALPPSSPLEGTFHTCHWPSRREPK
jgi:hypothetical protein